MKRKKNNYKRMKVRFIKRKKILRVVLVSNHWSM